MRARVSRRDFLKSTAALPAWLILPPWSASPLPHDDDLFAIDFGWRCYDPFFENDREFYQGGGASVFGGPELFEDYFDDDQINECIKNKTFGYSCKKSFLVRGFMRSGKSGLLSQNQDLACDDLRSRNPLSTFYCPSCGSGWWLGHVAEGFDETFFFSSCDDLDDNVRPLVTKVTVPPPPGTKVMRIGNEEWMVASQVPAEHMPSWEPVDFHAWVRKFEKGECSVEDFKKIEREWCRQDDEMERIWQFWETEHRRQWAETNRFLPNQIQFGT